MTVEGFGHEVHEAMEHGDHYRVRQAMLRLWFVGYRHGVAEYSTQRPVIDDEMIAQFNKWIGA